MTVYVAEAVTTDPTPAAGVFATPAAAYYHLRATTIPPPHVPDAIWRQHDGGISVEYLRASEQGGPHTRYWKLIPHEVRS